jgi:two-component sensor histidine kinase
MYRAVARGELETQNYEKYYKDERFEGWYELAVFRIDKNTIGVEILDITERKKAERQIKASLKEKEVLLAEVYHRVKNNMQVIISLLRLQAKNIEDKKHADMFIESEDRIRSMALIHEQLYQSQDFANIDFGEYTKSLVEGMFTSYGIDPSKIRFKIDIKDISFDLENAIPCGLIINELVSNSLKYAFPKGKEGQISVNLRPVSENEFELMVSDDGIGTPKELDIRNVDTMGLSLVRTISEHQLDGKIDLDRTGGTQFNIKFKRAAYKPRI